MSIGARVVRGPDWKWDEQDRGEGNVGTVVQPPKALGSLAQAGAKITVVQWDSGLRGTYRSGAESAYDLRLLDNSQCGVVHDGITCDGCNMPGITGMRWKCSVCTNFDLCSWCYMGDAHKEEGHPFLRLTTQDAAPAELPLRSGAKRLTALGTFPGAIVKRSVDWKWADQDGGEGQDGKVVQLTDWCGRSTRDAVLVSWNRRPAAPACAYRLGHGGMVDVECKTCSSGCSYYPEHLPVLGLQQQRQRSQHQQQRLQQPQQQPPQQQQQQPPQQQPPQQQQQQQPQRLPPGPEKEKQNHAICQAFPVGQTVQVSLPEGIFKDMQETRAVWDPEMKKIRGKLGVVERITDEGHVVVRFSAKLSWPLHPDTLVVVPIFKVGDNVTVSTDADAVKKLQTGHGDWLEDMAKALGRTGKVTLALPSGDIKVDIDGRLWVLNPACCSLATAGASHRPAAGINLPRDDVPAASSSASASAMGSAPASAMGSAPASAMGSASASTPASSQAVKVGDQVRFDCSDQELAELQKEYGWAPFTAECRSKVGTVQKVLANGAVVVHYRHVGRDLTISARALVKVPKFNVGDPVHIIADADRVKELQVGHGDWNQKMNEMLGETGEVIEVQPSGDVRVKVKGRIWTLNPACCTLAKAASSEDSSDDDDDDTPFELGGMVGAQMDDLKQMIGEKETEKLLMMFVRAALKKKTKSKKGKSGKKRKTPQDSSDDESTGDSSGKSSDGLSARSTGNHASGTGGSEKATPGSHIDGTRLIDVVQAGDAARVQQILEQSPHTVDEKTEGRTALMVASYRGHLEIVQLLVLGNANINLKDSDGDTALHYAALGNQPEVIAVLMNCGAPFNEQNVAGHTALHSAVVKQHVQCVEALLECFCDISTQDQSGDTPLHDSISRGNRVIINLLVAHPMADLTVRNQRGLNVLQYCASKGDEVTIQKILASGTNIPNLCELPSRDGSTPLQLAVMNGYRAAAEVLLKEGKANIEVRNGQRQTPLLVAVAKGYQDVVQCLLEQGADIAAADDQGNTCLHTAILKPQPSQPASQLTADTQGTGPATIMRCLLEHGADVRRANNQGQTPLTMVTAPETKALLEKYTQGERE